MLRPRPLVAGRCRLPPPRYAVGAAVLATPSEFAAAAPACRPAVAGAVRVPVWAWAKSGALVVRRLAPVNPGRVDRCANAGSPCPWRDGHCDFSAPSISSISSDGYPRVALCGKGLHAPPAPSPCPAGAIAASARSVRLTNDTCGTNSGTKSPRTVPKDAGRGYRGPRSVSRPRSGPPLFRRLHPPAPPLTPRAGGCRRRRKAGAALRSRGRPGTAGATQELNTHKLIIRVVKHPMLEWPRPSRPTSHGEDTWRRRKRRSYGGSEP